MAAIDSLYDSFKRVHKRNAKAALVYSLLCSHPDVRPPQDRHAVSIRAENEIAVGEVAWFETAIKAL